MLGADIEKGLRVVDRILSTSDAELNDRAFLLSQFKNLGFHSSRLILQGVGGVH
jgi:hypothetical protein